MCRGPFYINYNCSGTLLEKAIFPHMTVLLSLLPCQFSAFMLSFIKCYLRTGITKARLHRRGMLTDTCLFKLSISDLSVRSFTWHKPRGGHLIQNSKEIISPELLTEHILRSVKVGLQLEKSFWFLLQTQKERTNPCLFQSVCFNFYIKFEGYLKQLRSLE